MATQLPLVQYALDSTGKNSDNAIHGEIQTLVDRTVRAFAPTYSPFFTANLVVRDNATGQVLTRGVDYECVELFQTLSLKWGAEICGVILITNTTVSSTVNYDYQTVGGPYVHSADLLVNLINSMENDNRSVAWPDILNKPTEFNPVKHLHDIGDTYGFEYVVQELERITRAITLVDNTYLDSILTYIDSRLSEKSTSTDNTLSQFTSHISNMSNPHQTNKVQIGLGNLLNMPVAIASDGSTYSTATQAQLSQDKYISASSLLAFRDSLLSGVSGKFVPMDTTHLGVTDTGKWESITRENFSNLPLGATFMMAPANVYPLGGVYTYESTAGITDVNNYYYCIKLGIRDQMKGYALFAVPFFNSNAGCWFGTASNSTDTVSWVKIADSRDIATLNSTISNINTSIQTLTATNTIQDNSIASLWSTVNANKSSLDNLTTRVTNDESSINTINTQQTTQDNRLSSLENSVSQINTTNANQDASINSLTTSLSTINTNLTATSATASNALTQANAVNSSITILGDYLNQVAAKTEFLKDNAIIDMMLGDEIVVGNNSYNFSLARAPSGYVVTGELDTSNNIPCFYARPLLVRIQKSNYPWYIVRQSAYNSTYNAYTFSTNYSPDPQWTGPYNPAT